MGLWSSANNKKSIGKRLTETRGKDPDDSKRWYKIHAIHPDSRSRYTESFRGTEAQARDKHESLKELGYRQIVFKDARGGGKVYL